MRVPDGTRTSDYDYELPPERVARYPAERRDASRLLVVSPEGPFGHRVFSDVADLFEPGDVLVLNESKVLPVRLLGRKPTGAPSEVFLLRPAEGSPGGHLWEALVRPGSKLKPGREVIVADDLRIEILDSAPGSGRIVRLDTSLPVEEALERHGHVPLPPYLGREDEPLDRERYQTVYARVPGSVAAPTAGFHFTEALFEELEARGVRRVTLRLHVGVGTFRPLDAEDPADHELHRERYELGADAVAAIEAAREVGGRVWAVGTTTVRTLESCVGEDGRLRADAGETDLFIRPPFDFRAVDCLLTNFHLPRSSLLMLVAAFAGYERTMAAYREAVAEAYRFYSYGDAMAVMRR